MAKQTYLENDVLSFLGNMKDGSSLAVSGFNICEREFPFRKIGDESDQKA
jgi:hypothetical protein